MIQVTNSQRKTEMNEIPKKTSQTRPDRWRFRPSKALQDAKAGRVSIFVDPLLNRNQCQKSVFELRNDNTLSLIKSSKVSRIPVLTCQFPNQQKIEPRGFEFKKEQQELDESYKQAVANKKERDDKEK